MTRLPRNERVLVFKLFRVATMNILVAALLSATAMAGSLDFNGDPARGETLYPQCMGCHSFERDRTGPRHCGLIGRRAGRVAGFAYSKAMSESGIVWTRETLDKFLSAPTIVVPGTTMGYAGIEAAQDRLDLIAYIELAGDSPAPCESSGESGQP